MKLTDPFSEKARAGEKRRLGEERLRLENEHKQKEEAKK